MSYSQPPPIPYGSKPPPPLPPRNPSEQSVPSASPYAQHPQTQQPTQPDWWRPRVGASWQIILSNTIDLPSHATSVTPDVEVYDLDLFETPTETIDTLHRLGKRVVAYFSAGSWEPGRPDSNDFLEEDKGSKMEGWEKERWLNVRSPAVRNLMAARIQLAKDKGFDGVDPDNVDGYDNKTVDKRKPQFPAPTKQDAISFITFLSSHAHSRSLSIGLKNGGDIIPSVLPHVDFCINEQCILYDEVSTYARFIQAGKPVFHIEYPEELKKKQIAELKKMGEEGRVVGGGFSTVLKKMDLCGWVQYLDSTEYNTKVLK